MRPSRYRIRSPSAGSSAELPLLRKSCTPCCDGIWPVSMDARAGEHTGEAQKKLLKRIPVDASLSRLGVFNSSVPAQFMAQGP